MPKLTGILETALYVEDLDRAEAFYAGVLDMPRVTGDDRHFIDDHSQFRESVSRLAALDFEQLVVAHGKPIVVDAKQRFVEVLARYGLLRD